MKKEYYRMCLFYVLLFLTLATFGLSIAPVKAQEARGPRVQPDAEMAFYSPEQHELYDGRFVITGQKIHQIGNLNDESPWDHMGDDATNLRLVEGNISLDVNALENTGTFHAELELPEGTYIVELDRIRAPLTVDNFLMYVVKGEYNNTIFHRIVSDFIVQGGGYDEDFNFKKVTGNIQMIFDFHHIEVHQTSLAP